ncbi:MAG: HK97 family phage prohead protease, partial [Thermoguttaceae bacterium]
MRSLFCKISDREILQANLLEAKPRKVKFVPAYSGGKLFTSGITIPEPLQIGDETYAAGTSLPTVVDLDTVQLEQNIPILYSHNPDYRLGHTYSVKCDGEAVVAEGLLESPSQWNQEVITSFKTGARWQASLGSGLVDPTQKEVVPAGEYREINGQTLAGPYIILHNLAIREISIVPAGADPQTEVLLASLNGVKTMNFEEFCASKGFDLATLDEANKAALEALFNALNVPEGDPTNEAVEAETCDEEEAEAAEAAPAEPEEKEEVKASALSRVFPSLNVPKYSAQKAEPAPTGAEIFQASALLNLGVPGVWLTENGYSKRCVDLADKKAGEASILSAMGEALHASGLKPDYRNPHAIVRSYSELLKGSNVGTKEFGDVNVFSPIIDK